MIILITIRIITITITIICHNYFDNNKNHNYPSPSRVFSRACRRARLRMFGAALAAYRFVGRVKGRFLGGSWDRSRGLRDGNFRE
jgi:hypothetical protein